MGGRGDYYDRDVTSQVLRNARTGVSSVAERELVQSRMDKELLPRGRRLSTKARSPLIYDFDVTGSMGNLPKIIWDKWPGIVGQVVAREYLPEAEMSITATGDIRSDRSPLQMSDFSALRNLDRWLKRIHFEGNGGGQGSESYEMTAYYYLNFCDMPRAELPIYLITGDEMAVDYLFGDDLAQHFGGTHKDTSAEAVFAALKKKFKGNLFRIHREYTAGRGPSDRQVRVQWEGLIGKDRLILLPGDLAIGDITLGLYAIVSGARTLSEYLKDMRTRPLDLGEDVTYEPQSPERVRQVEEALAPLKDFRPIARARQSDKPKKAAPKAAGDKKSWQL